MTAKAAKKKRSDRSAGSINFGKLLLSSCIGMAILTGLLFLAAVLCLRKDASGWALTIAAYLCCAVSAFPVGCIAAKTIGKSGLLCGLLSTFPLCVLLLILCLSLYGSVASGYLIGTALILFFGALGGVAALNLRQKRRYR